jgi:hypothetical protein
MRDESRNLIRTYGILRASTFHLGACEVIIDAIFTSYGILIQLSNASSSDVVRHLKHAEAIGVFRDLEPPIRNKLAAIVVTNRSCSQTIPYLIFRPDVGLTWLTSNMLNNRKNIMMRWDARNRGPRIPSSPRFNVT